MQRQNAVFSFLNILNSTPLDRFILWSSHFKISFVQIKQSHEFWKLNESIIIVI